MSRRAEVQRTRVAAGGGAFLALAGSGILRPLGALVLVLTHLVVYVDGPAFAAMEARRDSDAGSAASAAPPQPSSKPAATARDAGRSGESGGLPGPVTVAGTPTPGSGPDGRAVGNRQRPADRAARHPDNRGASGPGASTAPSSAAGRRGTSGKGLVPSTSRGGRSIRRALADRALAQPSAAPQGLDVALSLQRNLEELQALLRVAASPSPEGASASADRSLLRSKAFEIDQDLASVRSLFDGIAASLAGAGLEPARRKAFDERVRILARLEKLRGSLEKVLVAGDTRRPALALHLADEIGSLAPRRERMLAGEATPLLVRGNRALPEVRREPVPMEAAPAQPGTPQAVARLAGPGDPGESPFNPATGPRSAPTAGWKGEQAISRLELSEVSLRGQPSGFRKPSAEPPSAEASSPPPVAADLAPTPEVQFTPGITALAASLGNDPVRIYEHVRNGFAYEVYEGSAKGAQATLETGRGNDFDLASLLIALLRAAGVPARYQQGVAEIPVAGVVSWLGVRHPNAPNTLLNTAGITAVPVVDPNAQIQLYRIDRVWVIANVPWSNYRGSGDGPGGSIWVPLDPAYKTHDLQPGIPGMLATVPFDESGFLQVRRKELPWEYWQRQVGDHLALNVAGTTLEDVPVHGPVRAEAFGLMPASLPYRVASIGSEYAEIPDALRYKVTVTLQQGLSTLFSRTLVMPVVARSRITISYSGGAPASAPLAQAFGGAAAVPAFLTSVTPELKLDGVVDASGPGVTAGSGVRLRVGFIEPGAGLVEEISHEFLTAGDYLALGLDTHQIGEAHMARRSATLLAGLDDAGTPAEDPDEIIGEFLYLAAMSYFKRIGDGDDLTGGLASYRTVRRVSEGAATSTADTVSILDLPFALVPNGMTIDVQRQSNGRISIDADASQNAAFRRLTGFNGSAQEHATWEELVAVEGVSTIKSFQIANEASTPIFVIDNTDGDPNNNCSVLCPQLNLSASVESDIQAQTAAGKRVTTPRNETPLNDWHGVGYLVEDVGAGSAAYLISGFLAGGATTRAAGAQGAADLADLAMAEGIAAFDAALRAGLEILEVSESLLARLDLPWGLELAVRDLLARGARVEITSGEFSHARHRGWVIRVTPRGEDPYFLFYGTVAGGSITIVLADGTIVVITPTELGDFLVTFFGDPVNVVSGNLLHAEADVRIASPGMPLEFARAYNNQTDASGPLGYGWTHSYGDLLVEDPNTLDVTHFGGMGGVRLFTHDTGGSYTPPAGVHDTLVKDATGFSLVEKLGTERRFDLSGRYLSIEDLNGNRHDLAYDPNGRFDGVADQVGRSLGFTYDGSGRIQTVSDHTGRTWTCTYDGAGDLVKVSRPSDADTPLSETQYSYYSGTFNAHNLQTITDPEGFETTFEYYTNDKVFRELAPDGGTVTYVYDAFHQQAMVVDGRGARQIYDYDAAGNIVRIVEPDGGMRSFTYDGGRNRMSRTDERGFTHSYTYDTRGNILTVTDPLDDTTTWTHHPTLNRVTSMEDNRGNTVTFEYDPEGNLVKKTDPFLEETTWTHTAAGSPLVATDARGKTLTFDYAPDEDLETATDHAGGATVFTHDALGRLTQFDPPGPELVTYTHDLLDRTLTITSASGQVTRYAYDRNGNRTALTDAENRITTLVYDHRGQAVSLTDPLIGVTAYEFDVMGNLVALTSAEGRTLRAEYSQRNQKTRSLEPDGTAWTFDYDAAGNLIRTEDAAGHVRSLAYDELNRLSDESFSDGGFHHFTYDENGNLLAAANQHATVTFTYDIKNRIQTVADSFTGKSISLTWTETDNKKTLSGPEGGVTTWTYDDLNRLQTLLDFNGDTYSFTYDSMGRRKTLSRPNGTTVSYTYDNAGRMTLLRDRDASLSDIILNDPTLDGADSKTAILDSTGTHGYAYDALNRLVTASHPLAPAEAYTYDAVGNRLTSAAASDYTYDESNRMTLGEGAAFVYDAAGNVVERTDGSGTTRYAYDALNRLVEVTRPDTSVVTYKYDPFGKRIEKNVSGAITRYFYDQEDVVAEYSGAGTLLRRYSHGPGIDEPLSMVEGATRVFLHADHIGSITRITNGSGAVVGSRRFDAFGRITAQSGSPLPDYAFTGQRLDAETGLYHFRARYYDPVTGRFTTRDPEGILGGLNVYVYAQNNPMSYTDPSGRIIPLLALVAIGAVIGAVGGAASYHFSTPADQRTAGGYLGSAGIGAVAGGAGSVVFAGVSTIAAGGLGITGAAALAGGTSGIVSQGISDAFNGEFSGAGAYVWSAGFGALSGGVATKLPYIRLPIVGGTVQPARIQFWPPWLNPGQYFGPNSWRGLGQEFMTDLLSQLAGLGRVAIFKAQ